MAKTPDRSYGDDFADIVTRFNKAAQSQPVQVTAEQERLRPLIPDSALRLRIACINVGARLVEAAEQGQPLTPLDQLLRRDPETIKLDKDITKIVEQIEPAEPLTLGQIADALPKRGQDQNTPLVVARRVCLLLEAGELKERSLYERLSFPELDENPEMRRLADDKEPQTVYDALTLICEALNRRWHLGNLRR